MNKYLNPWSEDKTKRHYYENEARMVLEYRNVKVYKLFEKGFDYVLEGVCITQRAGISKETIDNILDNKQPVSDRVVEYLKEKGIKVLAY